MRFFTSKIAFLILLVTGFAVKSIAQEQLRPLSGNINLNYVPAKQNSTAKTASLTPLDLPFFDDFSAALKSPYPNSAFWVDSNVYVNTGFAKAPLSIGVATFDGLNKKGYPYNITAPVSSSTSADTLKSRPINLKRMGAVPYSADDSLYLSFYYQAEGNGEAPEPNDSLCLDFFKARQNKWVKVWGVKGYNPVATDTNFYRVMIYIKDSAYLDSSFQFRFRNKATVSGSLDHWHLDYIYLNKNRSQVDTSRTDIAFAYKSSSFLKNYWAMPYNHFIPSEMANSLNNFIRNNTPTLIQAVYQYSVFSNTGGVLDQYTGGSNNILPFQNNGYHNFAPHSTPVFTFVPTNPFTTSTFFTVKHSINIFGSPTADMVHENDTVEEIQTFSDYFARDDGGAEQGYYLNTYGAKTAVRYRLNVNDTLRAVKIFFDPIVNGQTIMNSSFRVCIWADGGGFPGSLIYKDSLVYPTYLQGGYNIMPTYTLTSCLPLNAGTYFVGIQQTTNQPLNVGFDKNTNHMADLYYDIGNGWTQSAIPGSIMINPMMGCTVTQTVGIREYEQPSSFYLYPNPAQNTLSVSSRDFAIEHCSIQLISPLGESVYTSKLENNATIDISHLANGVYFVYINGKQIKVSPQKLIISR